MNDSVSTLQTEVLELVVDAGMSLSEVTQGPGPGSGTDSKRYVYH